MQRSRRIRSSAPAKQCLGFCQNRCPPQQRTIALRLGPELEDFGRHHSGAGPSIRRSPHTCLASPLTWSSPTFMDQVYAVELSNCQSLYFCDNRLPSHYAIYPKLAVVIFATYTCTNSAHLHTRVRRWIQHIQCVAVSS